jgi:hypothetical protein
MLQKIHSFLNRIASWKSLLIFLAVYLFFNGFILKNTENKINQLAGKPVGIIDLTLGFNPQRTLMMVGDYGDESRSFYSTVEMTTDLIYPIVYAFLFGITLTLLYRKSSYAWVNILPFICLLFDYFENINVIILLRTYPQQLLTVAVICEIIKLAKWIIFGSVVLLVIIGLVSLLINRVKQKVPS